MFELKESGEIRITRGDTSPELPLFINKGTEILPLRYHLKPYDEVCVAVMQANEDFETASLKKVYNTNSLNEEGDVIIQFMPQDTELLSVGNYAYTVKLHNTVSGVVNTVIKATPFIIEG